MYVVLVRLLESGISEVVLGRLLDCGDPFTRVLELSVVVCLLRLSLSGIGAKKLAESDNIAPLHTASSFNRAFANSKSARNAGTISRNF